MESFVKILTLNVGMSSTLAGLTTLIMSKSVDLVFLQEVKSSTEQIINLLSGLGYSAEANVDVESPSTPGTAVVWKKILPVKSVYTLVKCRAQAVKIGKFILMNIYAPSGSSKRQERSAFFGQEIFNAFNLFPDCNFSSPLLLPSIYMGWY